MGTRRDLLLLCPKLSQLGLNGSNVCVRRGELALYLVANLGDGLLNDGGREHGPPKIVVQRVFDLVLRLPYLHRATLRAPP